MNVFRRMKDIVTSNVNSALDRIEDPEKMIDLSIMQLQDAITELKAGLAEKRLETGNAEREIREAEECAERWSERAALAVGKGLDGMAREAVTEKLRALDRKKTAEENLALLKNAIASAETNIGDAESRLAELKAASGTLKARARIAKDRADMNRKASDAENAQYARRMEELKARIERWEAEADIASPSAAAGDAEPTFRDLETEAAVERELDAIRKEAEDQKQIEDR